MEHFVATELKDGEIWLGNTSDIEGYLKRPQFKDLTTLRLGEQALDIHGKKIPTDYCRPVFLHKSEEMKFDKIQIEISRKINRGY